MTTLILGGTGFLGARLSRRLVDSGEKIVSLDVLPDAASIAGLHDKMTLLRGDVSIIEDVLSAVRNHRVDRIINLAYILSSESYQLPHTSIRVNALGASNVFEVARLANLERVIFASSIAVYGEQSLYGERPVLEQDITAPANLYGTAKLLNEQQAAVYQQLCGMRVVAIRVGVIAGHGRTRGQGLWADKYASDPAVGNTGTFPFTPHTRASLIYVDDVAELFARVLFAENPRHSVYNSGGYNVSLDELATMVRQIIPGARHNFGEQRLNLPYLVSSAMAETEFAWSRRPLAERLRDHVAAARKAQSR